ncbi:DNA-binding protein [Candidatus Sumerlaeota bacterium]|nr:DNA-binding protein [Candidatus Sumerlaeota bacterium]
MKSSEGKTGRVFVIRLEDGDKLPDCLEAFAKENRIVHGQVILVGGIGEGSVVVGPRKSEEMPPEPMLLPIDGAHEVIGAGVIAPDEKGNPILHIHGALGRSGQTVTGCFRYGVETWIVAEAVIIEFLSIKATRLKDEETGFTLLEPNK